MDSGDVRVRFLDLWQNLTWSLQSISDWFSQWNWYPLMHDVNLLVHLLQVLLSALSLSPNIFQLACCLFTPHLMLSHMPPAVIHFHECLMPPQTRTHTCTSKREILGVCVFKYLVTYSSFQFGLTSVSGLLPTNCKIVHLALLKSSWWCSPGCPSGSVREVIEKVGANSSHTPRTACQQQHLVSLCCIRRCIEKSVTSN